MAPKKKEGAKKAKEKKEELTPEEKAELEKQQLEGEISDLSIEISFLKDKVRHSRADTDRIQAEVDDYKVRLAKATQDYADILEHRENQIKTNEAKVTTLTKKTEADAITIEEKDKAVSELEVANKVLKQKLEDASNLMNDKDNLEEAVQRQAESIQRQLEEIHGLKSDLEGREGELVTAASQIDDLTLKTRATTELKIFFDEPWLVTTTHHRLRGAVPLDRECGSVTALSGGKTIILYGGSGKGEGMPKECAVLNVDAMEWDRPLSAKTTFAMVNQSVTVTARTKLLVMGGYKNDQLATFLATLNSDSMRWTVPSFKVGQAMPEPRLGHSMACIREKVFVFGGQTAAGLTNELWVLDQDSMQWTSVTTFGIIPSPRIGASLCATEDGRRLYVYGGFDGETACTDMYVLETERLTWNSITVPGGNPPPREGHMAQIVSQFMMISGGRCPGPNGSIKRLSDTWVFDLSSPLWEQLDDGAWSNSIPWLKPQGIYSFFFGNRQFILKPNREEQLDELQVIEFALPEDIERLKKMKKKDTNFSDTLEIIDDAMCGSNFIEIAWRPPTKNSDRIDRFKLMMATTTGNPKEVCQGDYTRYRAVGLKGNTEYIFCVKAIYDDGSFLWSESKSFFTKT